MNTQSHAILNFFLLRWGLGERIAHLKRINTVLFSGALLPDLPIFLFFFWYTLIDHTPQMIIWRELYFRPDWQAFFNPFHSLPLWTAFVLICALSQKPRGALFGMAGLLSIIEDLLLHHEDAHTHFWPFSDYRFASPISYWNPAHHGGDRLSARTAAGACSGYLDLASSQDPLGQGPAGAGGDQSSPDSQSLVFSVSIFLGMLLKMPVRAIQVEKALRRCDIPFLRETGTALTKSAFRIVQSPVSSRSECARKNSN